MAVLNRHLSTKDAGLDQRIVVPLTTATSQTKRGFFKFTPASGGKLLVRSATGFCRTLAGTVTARAYVVGSSEIITAGAVTVHATPEQLALAASRYIADGVVVEKAAATGITFSAAHVISASKYGVILLQINSSGTVSSKVPLATQAYDSAAEALAALPTADSGKTAIAYIAIANNGSAWTANTDDLTNGSDVTTAAITTLSATATSVLSADITFVGGSEVTKTASHETASTVGESIYLDYTSDGSGALTDGCVVVQYRSF